MSKQCEWILKFLRGRDWTSPTEIGNEYSYYLGVPGYHSSWASPKCLSLVKEGLLERNKRGWYKLVGNSFLR